MTTLDNSIRTMNCEKNNDVISTRLKNNNDNRSDIIMTIAPSMIKNLSGNPQP